MFFLFQLSYNVSIRNYKIHIRALLIRINTTTIYTQAYKQLISSDVCINLVVMVQYITGLMSPPEQERFKFAQETVKAEAWLKAKEPLITTSKEPEGGEARAQTDEVEQLILRHEAFRKAAVTWKERFSSLRQLSAVSLIVD